MIFPRHPRRSPAFTLLEVIVVSGLLAAVLGIAAQMLATVRRQAQAADHQAIAMRTLENGLEQLTSLPGQELEASEITSDLLSEQFRNHWPQAKLVGDVRATDQPLPAKQITLELTLSSLPRARAARLTTWTYRNPRP